MAINLDHVTEQITVTDTAANASLTVNPKGTGAFNIAAGSGGLNLSNGGTVTALTLTANGGAYTSVPSVVISAPTTAGGVQATATVRMSLSLSLASGGTGYTVGDVLTVVGGTTTFASQATVTTVSSGVITGITTSASGEYSVMPSSPASVTGGTGSGATLNLSGFVRNASFTITNAGSGYVEQPTVTFSGGGGSGAAAYASVGSAAIIKSIGENNAYFMSFRGPNTLSDTLRLGIGNALSSEHILIENTQYTRSNILALGSANSQMWLGANGSGVVNFSTNGTSLVTQARVSHTASAVNYVNITGAGTGGAPSVLALGSDTNIPFSVASKGTGILYLSGGQTRIASNGSNTLYLAGNAGSVNFVQITGAQTGVLPSFIARGGDANVGLTFGTFNDANIDFYASGDPNAGSGRLQLRVAPTASAVNYIQVSGSVTSSAPYLLANGSDTDVSLIVTSKGAGAIFFKTAGAAPTQLAVTHTASAVNYVNITGGTSSNGPTLSSQGPGGSIDLRLASKGYGGLLFYTNATELQFAVGISFSPVNYFRVNGSGTGVGLVLNAQGSDTNIPVVIQPKGTGSLQAQLTDSTATGGNARGANAIDWQTVRNAASQVASGSNSVVSGGSRNTASGALTSVVGGFSNSATGYAATIVGGISHTAAGYYNFIGGGFTNSGTSSTAVTSQNGTLTSGSQSVTLTGSNASIKVGQYITGALVDTNTYVTSINAASLQLSKPALGSGNVVLDFFTPHGVVVGGGNNQATGSYSFIGGGGDAGTAANRNVASGDWSTVSGGQKNVASGIQSTIGGGFNQTTSGANSTVGGGYGNSATNLYSSVGAGVGNSATGAASTISGGFNGTTRGINGYTAFPSCYIPVANAVGVSQAGLLILGKQTTDATATVITSDGGAASTANQIILPNNSAYTFRGEIVSGVTGGGNTKGWTIEGVIKRGANAASTALVGTPTVTSLYADAGASTWVIAVTADTTNGGLAVTFTGQAGTTIRTVAQIRTTEMTF
jgi:hypothetical protein